METNKKGRNLDEPSRLTCDPTDKARVVGQDDNMLQTLMSVNFRRRSAESIWILTAHTGVRRETCGTRRRASSACHCKNGRCN
jgi:hypothetical protein